MSEYTVMEVRRSLWDYVLQHTIVADSEEEAEAKAAAMNRMGTLGVTSIPVKHGPDHTSFSVQRNGERAIDCIDRAIGELP